MVIFFSGTGNSRYIAKLLASQLDDTIIDSSVYIKEKKNGEFASNNPFIFVFPTYAWKIPKVFENFILNSNFSQNSEAYFYMTCGEEIGNAIYSIKELCKIKGLEFKGLKKIVMPNNYILLYDIDSNDEIESKLSSSTQEVLNTIPIVKNNMFLESDNKVSIGDKIKSNFINNMFNKYALKSNNFFVTDNCNGCGICKINCPLGNIDIQNKKPVWNNNCTQCMSCINVCPNRAIEYGRKTQNKGRYYLNKNKEIELFNSIKKED